MVAKLELALLVPVVSRQAQIGVMMAVFQPRSSEELNQRLRAMGYELWCFENALASGAAEAASYSDGAPKSAKETGRWMRTVEQLHHGLVALQRNWERSDPDNQPTWSNEEKQSALVVSSGDENVGERNPLIPKNRNPKGRSFGSLVHHNEQLEIDIFGQPFWPKDKEKPNRTWVFLYNSRGGFVYSEISLPVFMEGSNIGRWKDRIILPRFDEGSNVFEAGWDEGPEQDFGFTIQRR